MAGRVATVQFDAISANSDPFFNGPTDDASMLDRLEVPKLNERLGEAMATQIVRDNVVRAFRRGDIVT